jgi:hypothetical protein
LPQNADRTGLPDFLVIGAMKAGTTSLHHYLAERPDVFVPPNKELNFFRTDADFDRGLDWYRRQFADAAPGQLLGEVSPDYTKHPHHPGAAERIHRTIPDARLVFLAREPLARMRSMYVHQVAAGRETRPIAQALTEDQHYLEVSQYGLQLSRYLDLFDRDRLLVVASDDLAAGKDATMQRVCGFLGASTDPPPAEDAERTYNKGTDRRHSGIGKAVMQSRTGRAVFARLPGKAQDRFRALGTKPVPPIDTELDDATRAELTSRLAPDLEIFRTIAPDVAARWEQQPG